MAKELSPIVSVTEIYPSSRDSSCQDLSFPQHAQHFEKSRISDEEAVGTEYSRSEASASKVKPDPNIVRISLVQRRLLSKIIFTGCVGRSQRSLKPKELDSQEEMDRKAP
jgi:hypothetical protein